MVGMRPAVHTQQVIKYFSRAHSGIPKGPVVSNAAWYGPRMLEFHEKWLITLTSGEVENIREAVRFAVLSNKTIRTLTVDDFPLGGLSTNTSAWRRALNPEIGLGVVVLRGLPIHTWTAHEQEILWWGLGLHIGIPGVQNGQGDLLGRVSNEFYTSSSASVASDAGLEVGRVRQYRTSEKIEFHCDPADVVGLLCLRTAGLGGGRSRLASSVTVFNELWKRHPELVPLLFESLPLDSRGDGGINWFPVTPCTYSHSGVLRTFWHTEYLRSAYRYADSPQSSVPPDVARLIDAYDAIANDPAVFLEMDFREGDVQLISNHVVIHSRTEFFNSDEHQRQLLRLWLSLPFGQQITSSSGSDAEDAGLPPHFQLHEALSSSISGVKFVIGLAKMHVCKALSAWCGYM